MSLLANTRTLLISVLVLFSSMSVAQQVVESRSTSRAGNSSTAELYHKIQQLEQEVMSLRGQLEEQQHKLRRLSKQRLDDYVSLDKRISSLSGGGSLPPTPSYSQGASTGSSNSVPPAPSRSTVAPAVTAASTAVAAPSVAAAPSGDPSMEQGAYQAAYDLVKLQRHDEAIPALKDFILLYPSGKYAANAHYWLGELYLLDANLDGALAEFDTVVKNYPRTSKAADALYKLGRAHHIRGDSQTARIMLNRVINEYGNSGSNAVQLARDYLANDLGGR